MKNIHSCPPASMCIYTHVHQCLCAHTHVMHTHKWRRSASFTLGFHPPGLLWPEQLQGLQRPLQVEMDLNSLLGKASCGASSPHTHPPDPPPPPPLPGLAL